VENRQCHSHPPVSVGEEVIRLVDDTEGNQLDDQELKTEIGKKREPPLRGQIPFHLADKLMCIQPEYTAQPDQVQNV
jgi:hypothetical protein